MAVEYDISSDVAVIKETGSVSQCARVTQMYSGQITYDDEAGSKFATATINGKSQRVMLCIAVNGTVTYDDVPSLYSTVDGHRCLNIVTPTETGTPDDVPSLYETVVIDGQNVRAVRCIMINKTPVYDGVSSTCTFTGDDGKTHTAQLVNQVSSGGIEVIVKGVSPLSLPDAIANSLSYVKAFGGTEQNGTPTPDAPVDIVSNNGVLKHTPNLLDMSAENIVLGKYINNSGAILDSGPNFYNSKYIPVVGGETYTWSTSSSIGYFSVMEYDSGYVFKRRTLFGSSSSSPAGTSGTVTLRSDTAFVLIGSNMDSVDITLDRIAAVDWQFEKGTSATAYKPYSPTGFYTDGTVETINAHGKNLFNQALFNTDVANTITYTTFEIPNGTYTMSTNFPYAGGATNVFVFAGEVTSGASTPNNGVYNGRDRTITVLDGKYTVAYRSRTSDTSINTNNPKDYDFQLELGSTATEYAPYYDGGTATAEMLLKVGDYTDVQSILDGVVTRNVGVLVLDSSLEWTYDTTYGRVTATIPNLWGSTVARTVPGFCTHFEWLSHQESISSITPGQCYSAGANRIILHTFQTSATAFSRWLDAQKDAGTPVIIVFPLENATTESVTGQALQVTDGDNVLEITQASLDGLELEAQYSKNS